MSFFDRERENEIKRFDREARKQSLKAKYYDSLYDGKAIDTSGLSEADRALVSEIGEEARIDKANGDLFVKAFKEANAENGYLPWK